MSILKSRHDTVSGKGAGERRLSMSRLLQTKGRADTMDGWETEGGATLHPQDVPRGHPGAIVAPECVRVRAYQIYQARLRAGRPGDSASDWRQAEREMGRSR